MFHVSCLLAAVVAWLPALITAGVTAVRSPRRFLVLASLALLLGTLGAIATFRVDALGPVHVKLLHPELTGYWDSAYIRATGSPAVQWATDEPAYVANDVRSAYFWGGVCWNALFYSGPAFLLVAMVGGVFCLIYTPRRAVA